MNADVEFKSRFETLLNESKDLIKDFHFITLASNRKPWLETSILLEAGDSITSFAAGQTRFKELPICLDANFQVWFRIGLQGEVFRGTRDSHSFTAEQSGKLYLGSYFPGEWASKRGELATPDEAYALAEGDFNILLIRWKTGALESLKQIEKQNNVDPLIRLEIDRLQSPVLPPEGWHYLWFTGPAEAYQTCKTPENQPAVCCQTHKDAALLQKEIILPLKPDTRLRWSWKIDCLPSEVREDHLITHDYLSIAVEFDNGQDITYYWSAELEPETVYRCPIPTWTARETHVVIRSGQQGLGEWQDEARDVYADYAKAIGGDLPGQIVRVWFIAVSLFQRKPGQCSYANIRFLSDGKVIQVY